MERFYFMSLLFGLVVWNIGIAYSENSQNVNHDKSKSYCYIKNPQIIVVCDFSQQISIVDVSYERNCTSHCKCSEGDSQLTCDNFKLPDSWRNYYFYNGLSGKHSNFFSGKRNRCPTNTGIYSNYGYIKYRCVANDNIIQFGDVTNTTGSIVYLQYVGGKHAQRDWYCTASTTSPRPLEVYAVDVRFQKYGVPTGNCDLGQKSYLYLSDNKHSNAFRCEDKAILGNYDTMFNSTESKITIQLHLDEDPQFVWIAVSAGGTGLVNVTCHDVMPTNPPSINIDTTSGVISSQTTYIFPQSTTPVIIENNSNEISEVSTQVIETANKGIPITTSVILETTRRTSAAENSSLTVLTSSKPGGMQNIGQVSTTSGRRNSSSKTENDNTAYIVISACSSTVAILLLIALVVTCIRYKAIQRNVNRTNQNVNNTNQVEYNRHYCDLKNNIPNLTGQEYDIIDSHYNTIDDDGFQPSNNIVCMEGGYISVEPDEHLTTNLN